MEKWLTALPPRLPYYSEQSSLCYTAGFVVYPFKIQQCVHAYQLKS